MIKSFATIWVCILLTSCSTEWIEENNQDPPSVFDAYWHEIDRHYAFFDELDVNWKSVYNKYRPLINPQTTNAELHRYLEETTSLLMDAHTNLFTPFGTAGNVNYFNRFKINLVGPDTSNFPNGLISTRIFDYQIIDQSNLGYIRIKTFIGSTNEFNVFDDILTYLSSTNGIIIDVRSNGGGMNSNAAIIASRLIDQKRVAGRMRIRNGPNHTDFTDWSDISISPQNHHLLNNRPVAVLTNRRTFSASEKFVMYAEVCPNVTVIGDTTGGGSGTPIVRELPNGWIVRTSNTQTQNSQGREFQFTGLYPDIPIWISDEDSAKHIDTILNKAIELLSRPD